ncbi:MAG: hypothetical protein ABIJ75_04205, partial [Actinomycetota bacterium]
MSDSHLHLYPHRRGDPFVVAHVPQRAGNQHLARIAGQRLGADRLEIQPGRVHRQADGGIGGGGPGGQFDDLDPEQPG